MPQLDPTWFVSQLFWLFVCFTILYLLLSRLILPPLQGVITSRKGVIANDLGAAQDFKSRAEQAKLSYENTLAKSREAAQSLISEAEAASKIQAEEAIKALDAQVAVQAQSASSAIAAKKQQLLNDLTSATFELPSLIVEKLTHKIPNMEQVKHAVSMATTETQG